MILEGERSLPICMSSESIWGLLSNAKNQTRRVITPQPVRTTGGPWLWKHGKREAQWPASIRNPDSILPYMRFRRGDVLWVREAWASSQPGLVAYKATLECGRWIAAQGGGRDWARIASIHGPDPSADPPGRYASLERFGGRWHSPRFMPKWAARFYLRVTWVRVERLGDITEQDAKCEGAAAMFVADPSFFRGGVIPASTHLNGYRIAWEQINGQRFPWASNPWVTAVGFEDCSARAFSC